MIERVASAIIVAMKSDTPMTILERREYVARAAIEAMRWPTYEMRDAGARRGNWNENELGNELDCADNVWFAMIDAALKDEA